MEFHEKLQDLRKAKGLTQEELAQTLFVSRTAISKWESGRGYPNIDSLKAIAKFFCVTIDELLSGEEALTIAEEDHKKRHTRFCDLLFGLLDLSVSLFLFLPVFRQQVENTLYEVALFSLTEIAPYLKAVYCIVVCGIILLGILTLALQNCDQAFWKKNNRNLSLSLNAAGVLLFIISPQPYAAAFLFVFLVIKILMLLKKQ
jgi:transcriptional regulator with XRE-family HTH domain